MSPPDSNVHIWLSFRELSSLIDGIILHHKHGKKLQLKTALKKHKPNFISLLKNTPPSLKDRELIKKAEKNGIDLPGCFNNMTLSSQIIDEVLIISDLFELNEVSSLHLLSLGEEQLSQYPGLTRGLVAILLYYDSRKSIVQSLKSLIQSRIGVNWTIEIPEDISSLTTEYTTELFEEELVDKILGLLKELDLTTEIAKLQRNMALGDAKHRKQVKDLFEDTRQDLADCIFCYSVQSGLSKQETLSLFDYLSKVKPSEGTQNGVIDNVTFTLTMAALYAMDISSSFKCEDTERLWENLPIFVDKDFIPTIHKELSGTHRIWENVALQSLLQFGWSMLLSSFRSMNNNPLSVSLIDEDESILDLALENKLFHSLLNSIFANQLVFKEEFYLRRFHQLITDFIVLMPLKIKELRNRADDAGRNKIMHDQEGVNYNIPLAGQHFEYFLKVIAQLYSQDPLKLGLILEYWCPQEGVNERIPQRQVSMNKFVRLAGDLLVPNLFTPYLQMLVSLSQHPQASLHCFNLLKIPGVQQVSWDHFFTSLHQYYVNLRQGISPMLPDNSTIYSIRNAHKGISPQELNGLTSVLRLIQVVCNYSEVARVTIGDHSTWQPILICMGLLSCAVPTGLKSEILLTLASLAKSQEFSLQIWQYIEASQLITTKNSAIKSSSQAGVSNQGIITEFEEIETRKEEYPMMRAFLKLLDVLTDTSLPANLGTSAHIKSFAPYLSFLKETVFFRYNTRPYKNPAEKWIIASSCLSIFLKLLMDYEPQSGVFEGDHPGFLVMTDLLQSSELLQMIFFNLEEGCRLLESYVDFPGKEDLEISCLKCLQILEIALSIQDIVLNAARNSQTSLLCTSLDKLILGVNSRTGKADHALNIAKFITYYWWLPQHTVTAVRVLAYISSSLTAQPSLLATFNSSEHVAKSIVKGFTDVLDEQDMEGLEAAKIDIVKLIQTGIDLPTLSFSHFLLGSGFYKNESGDIQPPKISGIVRTPFHAILGILKTQGPKVPPLALKNQPKFCEAAYKLIYTLTTNPMTSEPVLRYLRSSEDFLASQLALLPLDLEEWNQSDKILALKSISWLLKTVAVEIKIVSSTRLRSQISHLAGLLLDTFPYVTEREEPLLMGSFKTDATLTQLSRTSVANSTESTGQHRLLAILNSIDFKDVLAEAPLWELFDNEQVHRVLKNCESVHSSGERSINIPELHQILNVELQNLQGSSSLHQRPQIQKEIQKILLYAVNCNSIHEYSFTRRQLLDAWRQVTEVLLCSIPLDILPSTYKQQLLLELLQTLLNKVLQDDTMSELANKVSGVLLLLLSALRQTYSSTSVVSKNSNSVLEDDSNIVSKKEKVYSTALQVILKGIAQWIIRTCATAQRVRSNLYGALLNYLRIGKSSSSENQFNTSNLLELSQSEKFKKSNIEVLSSFGDNFLEVICRDSVSGHDVRRMLAMSVIDELISLDAGGSWIWYLSNQGYLRHLIESLKNEDENLSRLITSYSDEGNYKFLYAYETKMGMLARLASTSSGAELLMESGLMVCLAGLRVFSSRPEASNNLKTDLLERYYQILFPVLKLCQAILASLGGHSNKSVIIQILHFINANDELVQSVLRGKSFQNIQALKELSLLTSVISRCTYTDGSEDLETIGNMSKLQKLMLSMIPKLVLRIEEIPEVDQPEAVKLSLGIHASVIFYARSVISLSSNSMKLSQILFAPSLSDARPENQEACSIAIPNRAPSLGHLVNVLRTLVDHLTSVQSSLVILKDKMTSLHSMSSTELSEFVNIDEKYGNKRSQAHKAIVNLIHDKEHQVSLSGSTIENICLILWMQLEYFFCYQPDVDSSFNSSQIGFHSKSSGDTSFATISLLKEECASIFSNSFFLKLQDVEQLYTKKNNSIGFLDMMIRKLQRLVATHTLSHS